MFDDLTLDDNTLLAAPQFVPSDDKLTRIGNILQYGTFGGGYGTDQAQLMSTADELFLGKQDSRFIWQGLYPLLTMARHSCCPNSVICYAGETAMLRATQDLLAGDQLTISYMAPLSVPMKDRQQRLQKMQNFKCACPRCTVEGKLPSSIQTKIQAIQAQLGSGSMKPALAQFGRQKQGKAGQRPGQSKRRKGKTSQHRGNAKAR